MLATFSGSAGSKNSHRMLGKIKDRLKLLDSY